MAAIRIFRRFRDLLDVTFGTPADGDVVTYDLATDKLVMAAPTGGGGGGTVDSVTAGDSTITIGGTASDPTVAVNVIAESKVTNLVADLAAKQPLDADLTAISGLDSSTSGAIASDGAGWIKKTYAQFKTALGLVKGDVGLGNVVNLDTSTTANITDSTDKRFVTDAELTVLGNTAGTNTGDQTLPTRASLGLDTTDSPQFAGVNIGAATDTTVTRTGAGDIAVEGNQLYRAGGTDVPVADGGTGASDASGARTNLGLVIGTDVEAHDTDLTTISGLSPANDDVIQRKAGAWANRSMAQLIADLAALGTTFQPLDADLTALAGLTSAADKLPYFTGSGTAAVTTLSSFIRTLLDDADAATARATLGVIASLFQSGGAQAIALDTLAAPTDITTLNASTSAHGLLQKLDNNSAHFLDGTGAWSTPAGGGSTDGWTSASDTWTYASATTFTISGVDRTAIFQPGTYLKLTQTTAKYFVVVSSSFSTNTTVTITGGTDYSLANASITSPFYSYEANPQGFPFWFNHTPTFTGFSANPTVNMCRFAVSGRTFFFKYNETANGTSNATTFTMTGFPFTAPSGQPFLICVVTDAGTTQTTPGYCQASGTSLNFFKTFGGTGFTNSGGKGAIVNAYWQI